MKESLRAIPGIEKYPIATDLLFKFQSISGVATASEEELRTTSSSVDTKQVTDFLNDSW